ncbi:MAG: signal peptidase I [Armatimonadetes bacterium]|nr:signal peptidase I [Armatimonadota bacterium]
MEVQSVSWSSAVSDLANSWKVGIAFLVLVALRFALTSPSAFLQSARTLVLGGLAGLLGSGPGPGAALETDGSEEAAAEPPPLSPADQLRRSVLEFIDSGLIALVLVFLLIRPFVVQAFYIPSGSMKPTLQINDKILVNKFIYRFREPRRGDVVVFRAPPQAALDEKDFIKRLIGLSGDVIEVRKGRVYLNGQARDETYIAEPPAYGMAPVVVEPGKVFVMGDNRNDSNDSHAWGQLDESRIRGEAMFIFWPFTRVGLVR